MALRDDLLIPDNQVPGNDLNLVYQNARFAVITGGDFSFLPEEAEASLEAFVDWKEKRFKGWHVLVLDFRQEVTSGLLEDDATLWSKCPNSTYVVIGTDDRAGHSIPDEVFEQARASVMGVNHAGLVVISHCHMGVNRGPSVAMYLLMEFVGHSSKVAWEAVRVNRPQAAVYYHRDAFRAYLKRRPEEVNVNVSLDILDCYVEENFPWEERERVNHYIRGQHLKDYNQYQQLQERYQDETEED